jgi:hypothetical protein
MLQYAVPPGYQRHERQLLGDEVEAMTIQLHCASPNGLYTSSAELGKRFE